MKVLEFVDKDIGKFYEKSIYALGKLEKRPSEKEWNKIAKRELYMTSVSLKGYSEIDSWILLYYSARRLYNNRKKWAGCYCSFTILYYINLLYLHAELLLVIL